MLRAAPLAIGDRSRSRTSRFSVRAQPLSSYRLPIVSETGAKRTAASGAEAAGSIRNDLWLACSTALSATAEPRTTVNACG